MAKELNLKQLLEIQDQGGAFKFVASKELDNGEIVKVPLDNCNHAIAFERQDFDIELVEDFDEPKNKGGRPRKEE